VFRIEYAVPGRDVLGVGQRGEGVDILFLEFPKVVLPVKEKICCGENFRVGDKGSFCVFQDSVIFYVYETNLATLLH